MEPFSIDPAVRFAVFDGELKPEEIYVPHKSTAAKAEVPHIVLSEEEAVKCADLGAKAIIVSHHHGRLPYAVPPLMVLPSIKKALEGRDVKIFVDCGIASGADVYKCLALGADAAAVGRSMLPSLEEGGIEGMEKFIEKVNNELRFIMSCTGFKTTDQIDDTCIVRT